jgi:arylsulfatase A-like enzyme
VAWAREIKKKEFGYAYSLFLSHLYEPLQEKKIEKYLSEFPRGLPYVDLDSYFRLEDAIDWLEERIRTGPKPFFGYFHMIPPHYPYSPPKEFVGRFGEDGFKPVEKPDDIFQQNRGGNNLLEKRTEYDEFILYVDREFGRLYDYLEKTGVLENTWVILTSDHGEMFERRISGHRTSVLYQPVIHVPLLIFEPGRASRLDVTTPTSAIDVLPTLMHITGHEIPEWAEGKILPPYAPIETGRNIYALQAWYNGKYAPITYATATLIKDQYKLIYYFGYNQLRKLGKEEFVQLFDLQADPEELSDLSAAQPGLTSDLLAELKTKLDEVNKPYIQK